MRTKYENYESNQIKLFFHVSNELHKTGELFIFIASGLIKTSLVRYTTEDYFGSGGIRPPWTH